MTVWKYPIVLGTNELALPENADILSIQKQNDNFVMWALVYPKIGFVEKRKIICIGTGHPAPENKELLHIETVIDGNFVWHFFEVLG